jgi:hypothetical protein
MQISPFLEIFVATFVLFGSVIGWFTRIRVLLFAVLVALCVFALLAILSSFDPPANPSLTSDDVAVSAFIAGFAAVPALLAAMTGRFLRNRRES